MSEATPAKTSPGYVYQGLPWFDRVWVVLLLMVVLTGVWRVMG